MFKKNSTFIIAELSANHGQNLDNAISSIKAAKLMGADAIKLQTYTADTITIRCNNEYFRIKSGTIWDGRTLHDLYSEAYTPWEWHEELFAVARTEGLICLSSPFDRSAVDLLESLDSPIYKIASFEITDIPLIEYAASKGKPIIISTGIANLADIELAVQTCRRAGNNDITLLKCTSSYPAPIKEVNLLTIPNMRETFGVEVGLSDHTMGHSVALAAVALGATVVEKHFILDRSIGGPDASFSMNPQEFGAMVKGIREVESALGKVNYELTEKVQNSRVFSRSLFIVEDVKIGERVTEKNVRSIRPGNGMHPKYLTQVIGKIFKQDYEKGTPLSWETIE